MGKDTSQAGQECEEACERERFEDCGDVSSSVSVGGSLRFSAGGDDFEVSRAVEVRDAKKLSLQD